MATHSERRPGLWIASNSDERWGRGPLFDTREEAIAYAIGEGMQWTGQIHDLTDEEVADWMVRTCEEADESLAVQDDWSWCEDRLIGDAPAEAMAELHAFVLGWVVRHGIRVPTWRVDEIERVPSDEARAQGGAS